MAKLGASAGWSGNYAHDLTEASTLGSGDSGKVFFLNSATEFTTTLPACSGNAVSFFILKKWFFCCATDLLCNFIFNHAL